MAFPQVQTLASTDVQTGGTGAQVFELDLPTGIVSGDLLVVFFSCDDSVEAVGDIGFPAGWNEIFEILEVNDPGPDTAAAIAYRIADGTEGSTITVTTDADEQGGGTIYRIDSWHGTTPPEVSSGVQGSSSSPDPDSLTPSWGSDDTLWFAWGAQNLGDQTDWTGAPTSYTDLETAGGQFTGNGSTSIATARRENATATEDPGGFTMDASVVWRAGTLAVRPAAAPVVTDGGFRHIYEHLLGGGAVHV